MPDATRSAGSTREQHDEEMAQELAQLVRGAVGDADGMPVLVGTYNSRG